MVFPESSHRKKFRIKLSIPLNELYFTKYFSGSKNRENISLICHKIQNYCNVMKFSLIFILYFFFLFFFRFMPTDKNVHYA